MQQQFNTNKDTQLKKSNYKWTLINYTWNVFNKKKNTNNNTSPNKTTTALYTTSYGKQECKTIGNSVAWTMKQITSHPKCMHCAPVRSGPHSKLLFFSIRLSLELAVWKPTPLLSLLLFYFDQSKTPCICDVALAIHFLRTTSFLTSAEFA